MQPRGVLSHGRGRSACTSGTARSPGGQKLQWSGSGGEPRKDGVTCRHFSYLSKTRTEPGPFNSNQAKSSHLPATQIDAEHTGWVVERAKTVGPTLLELP